MRCPSHAGGNADDPVEFAEAIGVDRAVVQSRLHGSQKDYWRQLQLWRAGVPPDDCGRFEKSVVDLSALLQQAS